MSQNDDIKVQIGESNITNAGLVLLAARTNNICAMREYIESKYNGIAYEHKIYGGVAVIDEALAIACVAGHIEMVRLIVETGLAKIGNFEKYHSRILTVCLLAKDFEIATILIDSKTGVDDMDALVDAVIRADTDEALEYLFDKGIGLDYDIDSVVTRGYMNVFLAILSSGTPEQLHTVFKACIILATDRPELIDYVEAVLMFGVNPVAALGRHVYSQYLRDNGDLVPIAITKLLVKYTHLAKFE